MFRVASYQAVLRILLVFFGLLVCGAVAQDQPDAAGKSVADKPASDTASDRRKTLPAQPQAKPR